jgi:hypothetical protein
MSDFQMLSLEMPKIWIFGVQMFNVQMPDIWIFSVQASDL